MKARPWTLVLVPVVCFAFLSSTAYAYAVSHPLSWEYGHTAVRVNSTFTVPPGSQMSVQILGGAPIPARSFLETQVYVLTRGSGGNPLTANFLFSYNGEATAMTPGWGMHQVFETTMDTQGGLNPQYVVGNPLGVTIQVLEYGWVTVPPTTLEHFGMLLPWVAALGCALTVGIDLLVSTRPGTRSWTGDRRGP